MQRAGSLSGFGKKLKPKERRYRGIWTTTRGKCTAKRRRSTKVLLAPHTKEAMPTFVAGGGMQQYSVTRYLASRRTVPVLEDELDWFKKTRASETSVAFWRIWWGDDEATSEAEQARSTTLAALKWAEEHVRIL